MRFTPTLPSIGEEDFVKRRRERGLQAASKPVRESEVGRPEGRAPIMHFDAWPHCLVERPLRLPVNRLVADVSSRISSHQKISADSRQRLTNPSLPRVVKRWWWLILCACFLAHSAAQPAADISEQLKSDLPGQMRTKQGKVSYQQGQTSEQPAKSHQQLDFGDALRTHPLSRAAVTITNGTDLYLSEMSRLAIVPAAGRPNFPAVELRAGRARFIGRGGPASTPFQTPELAGVNRGTEFLVEVEPGRTVVTLFDGEADVSNADTPQPVRVRRGWQGIAVAGKPIEVRALIQAQNIVQWWIYYPGVLDADELEFNPAEQAQLRGSLEAYRSGDLQGALKQFPGYPTPPDPPRDAQRIYLAGVLLSVGAVDKAEAQLAKAETNAPLARALRTMIAAVAPPLVVPASAGGPNQKSRGSSSELLALSYQYQSEHRLDTALTAARSAVERSPNFAFGWARVAELEFSFGRTRAAHIALTNALFLTPRNAQAHALNGFLLAADNRLHDAITAFNRAIAIDPALGNAWLGRGLCKRRLGYQLFGFGDFAEWQQDIQTAAILEPQRSLLRSYAGKAFAEIGNDSLARKELEYAKHLDTNDPTPWLYSALLLRQENAISPAIHDLEKSIELNNNRAVYRSQLLLDQDRAVRSSSLANLYQSAGMDDVSVREAARAVSADYANYSAHQFLSESYNALRDPTRFNLRYETVWFNELLLANLLSPVGGTPLSQHISQQEYSRLFEQNRIGLTTDSSYRSDGQYRELASQFGVIGNTAWSLDLDYQHNNGVRPNNDLDRIEWYSTIKQQLTPQDSVMLLTKYQDYHSGDNFQYYYQTNARPNFRFDEFQHPLLVGGYHHEWSPGVHTLALGGRLANEQRVSDQNAPQLVLNRQTYDNPGLIMSTVPVGLDVDYRSELEIYTGELQQIFDTPQQTLLLGGRWQSGRFDTRNILATNLSTSLGFPYLFPAPAAETNAVEDFERLSVYAYETLKLPDHLRLTAGLTYENLRFPENFRAPPIGRGQETRDRLNPKAALTWDPLPQVGLRGIYARSLGGVSLDESFRLEPTQLAGFSQDFRTLIPESLFGSVAAPDHEILGGALELKFKTGTYVGFSGEKLHSDVRQTVGTFDNFYEVQMISPSSTLQRLDYIERSAGVTLNQLLGEDWSFGAQYQFTRSDLTSVFPEIPLNPAANQNTTNRADLHRLEVQLLFNHPSGFFAAAQSEWYFQDNRQNTLPSATALPDDSFQQFNLLLGYRFPKQRGDVTIGVLNLTGEDYHLNPVTPHAELPRERVFYARLRVRF